MRNHSLDEIFEVLLVTAQYRMEERGGHREKSEERREEGREEAKAGVENRGDAGEEYTSDFYEEDEGSSGDSIVLSDLDAVEDYGATPTNNSSSKIQPSIAVISLRKPVPAPDPPAPPSAAHAPVSASRAQRRPGGATQGEKKKRKKVHRPHRLDAPPPDEGELLDTVLADASFLQPQSVCEVVQEALEKLKPNKVNKKAFRKQVNALIEAQQLVDVHKVLTSPTKRIPHRKEVEQEPLPSFAPTLCEESIKRASKVYANRSTRRQPVENSLLACECHSLLPLYAIY